MQFSAGQINTACAVIHAHIVIHVVSQCDEIRCIDIVVQQEKSL